MSRSFLRIAALFTFVALLAAPAAFAQDATTDEVTDDELAAFANAYVDVEAIQAQYDEAAAATEDPEEAQAIQARYQENINTAIAAHGIDNSRYDAIVQTMQSDTEFAQRVLAKVQEVREERMGG